MASRSASRSPLLEHDSAAAAGASGDEAEELPSVASSSAATASVEESADGLRRRGARVRPRTVRPHGSAREALLIRLRQTTGPTDDTALKVLQSTPEPEPEPEPRGRHRSRSPRLRREAPSSSGSASGPSHSRLWREICVEAAQALAVASAACPHNEALRLAAARAADEAREASAGSGSPATPGAPSGTEGPK